MCICNVGIFIFNINKVLDVSIWKSPVAGWGWESIEAKDDWLRWLPVPFGLGFHLYNVCVTFAPPLILGWPNRKPWRQQPFANRPGAMVRIAIGFYVDSKHKRSGCSSQLAITSVVSDKSGAQYFRLSSGLMSKLYVFLNTVQQIRLISDHNLCGYALLFVLQGFSGLERTSLCICLWS